MGDIVQFQNQDRPSAKRDALAGQAEPVAFEQAMPFLRLCRLLKEYGLGLSEVWALPGQDGRAEEFLALIDGVAYGLRTHANPPFALSQETLDSLEGIEALVKLSRSRAVPHAKVTFVPIISRGVAQIADSLLAGYKGEVVAETTPREAPHEPPPHVDAPPAMPAAWSQERAAVRRVFTPRPRIKDIALPFLVTRAEKMCKELGDFAAAHASSGQAEPPMPPDAAAYARARRGLLTLQVMMQEIQNRLPLRPDTEAVQDNLWRSCGLLEDAIEDLERQKQQGGAFSPEVLERSVRSAKIDLDRLLPGRSREKGR